MLVLVVLAAIAVDTTTEYLARRELAAAADAAANDAVTFGLDEAAVRRALTARSSSVVDRAAVAVDSNPEDGTVTVTLRSSAHLVFSTALPGSPHDVDVVARATADVYVGD
jgi:uncharacterized membrane protein